MFTESILTALAHEITHKYLHINDISCGVGYIHAYENEILTDIAGVFLGFGKIMLNGCKCQSIQKEKYHDSVKTITKTLEIGYLKRDELAFVYRLICAMRKIPKKVFKKGLSSESTNAINNCENLYSYYFDNRFHEQDTRNKSFETLEHSIFDAQLVLSNIDKNLLFIREACIKYTESFLDSTHKRLNECQNKSQLLINDNEVDPCLKYLYAQSYDQTIRNYAREIDDDTVRAELFQKHIVKLSKLLNRQNGIYPKPNFDMFINIVCRNDGTLLSLPENKPLLIAKCHKCNYQFVADTSISFFNKWNIDVLFNFLKTFFKFLLSKLRKII